MEQFWRTRHFKVLAKVWDFKLEQSGLRDCEIDLKNERVLKQRSSSSYGKADGFERESRLEYYCFLGYLVHNTKFETELERLVLTKHAEGSTIKEIVEAINVLGINRDRRTIRFIIRRWQTKWGLKSWTLQQMNLKPK